MVEKQVWFIEQFWICKKKQLFWSRWSICHTSGRRVQVVNNYSAPRRAIPQVLITFSPPNIPQRLRGRGQRSIDLPVMENSSRPTVPSSRQIVKATTKECEYKTHPVTRAGNSGEQQSNLSTHTGAWVLSAKKIKVELPKFLSCKIF